MAISSQDIQNFLLANPGMTDAQIAAAMRTYDVTPTQLAAATNMQVGDVQSRFDVANRQNINQQVTTLVTDILGKGGNEFDVAREAAKLNLTTKDLATALKLPEQEITKLSGGVLNGVPARPTFSGVAAEWNKLHEARFGGPLNLARAAPEDVQRQVADLQAETLRKQAEWDRLYGNTPEAKAIQKEAPPDWRQVFEPYSRASIDRFGNTIDRPWSSDEGAINQKRILDDQYIKAVQDYNKKYGTNIAPDPAVLGTLAQPNEIVKAVQKDKWYEDPLNVAATLALLYFGAPYVAEAIAGTGAATGAASAAGGGAAELASVGATGYGLTGPISAATIPPGITSLISDGIPVSGGGPVSITNIPPSSVISPTVPSASNISLLDTVKFPTSIPEMGGGTGITPGAAGQGLQLPTSPNIASMGGGQGLTVPVTGGTISQMGLTPTGATPVLGSPSSFINNPEVLGQPVIQQGTPTPISPTDVLRTANTLRQLTAQPEQQRSLEQQATQMAAGAVDYSGLLNLLGSQARISGLLGTQFKPQPINLASLLG